MTQIDSWQGSTILASAEDDLVGKTLNDTYTVERVLGEGAMGRVYQARHTRIAQKLVAVKVLRLEHVRNTEVLARFQREAEIAASISHPNVVAVYDIDRTQRGLPYLVSEYLKGLDLGEYRRQKGKIGLHTTVHIVRQLCEGLEAAHRSGVIHRDLKPSNIFLLGEADGEVPEYPFIKILDFGLSKFMDAPDGQLVTKTGIIMGTPAFMPPEQAQGRQADHRADIYGVGALLYTCLTGHVPFDEATPQATVMAVIGTEPPRPRALEASIPEYAELVIQRAMAKAPEARFPDMAALLEALEPLVGEPPRRQESRGSRSESRASLGSALEEAKTARPSLAFFLLCAVILLLGFAALALVGLEQTVGWSLTRRELGLALLCGVAAAVTPGILVAARIRRRVWTNTTRVLSLLSGVRSAVLAAILTCGLAWLGFRVGDAVVLRLMGPTLRGNLFWSGWDLLLPALASGIGIVVLLRERALSALSNHHGRALVSAIASIAMVTLAAIVVPVGLRWQSLQKGEEATQPPTGASVQLVQMTSSAPSDVVAPSKQKEEATPDGSTAPPAPTQAAIPTASATEVLVSSSTPPPPTPPVGLASEEELKAASGRSVEGWLPLANRYPTDPRVLRPLVMAYASRAAGLGDAMSTASRLFQVAPEQAKSADLQYLVQRAAETPGEPASLAWKMLTEEMGNYGFDVLYRLTLTKPRLAERAERLLAEAATRQRLSPALSVARDLRGASSCAARLPYLERAVSVGDERAIAVLGGLSTGSLHGCGKNKRKPCPPACPEQAEQFRQAMSQIAARLKTSGEAPHP